MLVTNTHRFFCSIYSVILSGHARFVHELKLIAELLPLARRGRVTCEKALAGSTRDHVSPDVHCSHPSIDYGEEGSAIGIAQKIFDLGRQHIDEHAAPAIPGYRARSSAITQSTAAVGERLPVSSILGQQMPSMELVYVLLEEYFDSVHWFSLVVYEPNFRNKLHSIADGFAYPSQKPFLLLLAVMLGMGAWYRSHRGIAGPPDDTNECLTWSASLFKLVESHLLELMDQPSVTAAQICTLVGSHYVYHGRPNLSFSLLGATIKISQAAGLHRELSKGDFEDIEERKRVWWTIYTWDRFASITYGRPLGINDNDCNLSMPADVLENPYFITPSSELGDSICYSTYQRELNRLYLMASKALEAVFGSRTSGSSKELAGDAYLALLKEATENIQRWRSQLPDSLILDLEQDFLPNSTPSARAHALQSLSLQLTYDNILIVLYRPLLARQVDHLSTSDHHSPVRSDVDFPLGHSTAAASSPPNLLLEAVSPCLPIENPVHWWNAALRTSRVTELPLLVQLATDSHVVAFLAINLFNAAIVLAIMALSDPLSDTAQVVKRTITRILRLQDLLGRRSALSKQSTTVLKNVVALLLRRESEAILGPVTKKSHQQSQEALADPSFMSVEDTLRLPLNATLNVSDLPEGGQACPDLSMAHRLNQSLTSVQYVIPPGDNRFFDSHVRSDSNPPRDLPQENMRSDDQWQLSVQRDWSDPNATSGSVENATDGNDEHGLYWLWDMSWNGADM
ncbi:putative transcriptional regulatory protein C1683,13c [Talaromyces islandicus]|uniref:Putative transcriptional regulatory protein C1683,13c n=1 Tax=Talaromyces islandicus TaxID=28573 RepID=A0A0U1LK68_TALIS|nr:putative transcriptional regulatory protein C1683,13c [Talaromyces islandicus]